MRLRARMTRLGGHWVEASYIQEVVVPPEGEESSALRIAGFPLPLDQAEGSHYEILDANDAELEFLNCCGYRFLLATGYRKLRSV